jgi:hypothetical protein
MRKTGIIFCSSVPDTRALSVAASCFAVASTRFRNPIIRAIALLLIDRLRLRVNQAPERPLEFALGQFSDADLTEVESAGRIMGESLVSHPAAIAFLNSISAAAQEELRRRAGKHFTVQLH